MTNAERWFLDNGLVLERTATGEELNEAAARKLEAIKHYFDIRAQRDKLLEALKKAEAHLGYCGYGDSWERECAKDDGLPELIQSAIAKAEEN